MHLSCSTWNPVASPMDSSVPSKTSPPSHYPPITISTPHTPLTSPPASSYPAILVGRPTAENKPKVPPPVPPRGTPKTKRGGISAKGLQPRCFGHERHASAPVAATKDASLFSSESYSSTPTKKVCTLPTNYKVQKLKAELILSSGRNFEGYRRLSVPVRSKFFENFFEARNEILGRDYGDIKEERTIYPTNLKRPVIYDSNISLHKIDGRLYYEMDDYV